MCFTSTIFLTVQVLDLLKQQATLKYTHIQKASFAVQLKRRREILEIPAKCLRVLSKTVIIVNNVLINLYGDRYHFRFSFIRVLFELTFNGRNS